MEALAIEVERKKMRKNDGMALPINMDYLASKFSRIGENVGLLVILQHIHSEQGHNKFY